MKKDAFYFSHDSNAKDDPKCVLLIEQLGLEGYGIFWVLIEILREQPNYKYPLILLPALARRFNTSSEKINAVVSKYGLFDIENNEVFLSPSLTERMQYLEAKREKRSIAGQLGNEKRWGLVAIESQCDGKASLSKVKQSKVNNILSTEKNWRNDFELYKDSLRKGHKEFLANTDAHKKLIDRYPYINIKKSLDMICVDYWLKDGYAIKKKTKTIQIDWATTFINSFKFQSNRINYTKEQLDEFKKQSNE